MCWPGQAFRWTCVWPEVSMDPVFTSSHHSDLFNLFSWICFLYFSLFRLLSFRKETVRMRCTFVAHTTTKAKSFKQTTRGRSWHNFRDHLRNVFDFIFYFCYSNSIFLSTLEKNNPQNCLEKKGFGNITTKYSYQQTHRPLADVHADVFLVEYYTHTIPSYIIIVYGCIYSLYIHLHCTHKPYKQPLMVFPCTISQKVVGSVPSLCFCVVLDLCLHPPDAGNLWSDNRKDITDGWQI